MSGTAIAAPWTAGYRAELALEPPSQAPQPGDPAWRWLRQAWRAGGKEAGFKPAAVRVRWNERALLFDVILDGAKPRNGARGLNERTWEMGDICEIFLQGRESATYIELHVTPENQRLQLRWTGASFAAFRANPSALADHAVSDPAWVRSASRVGTERWGVSALVPIETLSLGAAAFTPDTVLMGAICRYDCTGGNGFVLSSTAPLREAAYHRREDWERLVLVR